MKSANTTPTAPKPEVNDENLDYVDDNQNLDDVDDDQPVVHKNDDAMSYFEAPYCPWNIETPEPKPEPELKISNESRNVKYWGRELFSNTFIQKQLCCCSW